ncbi:solute carrier organic anion transporter family member 74D isoform X2 [Anabrus simplex]
MNMFALGSYFVGTISTMEKRFKIPSRTSGIISSAWDIGSFFSLLVFAYLGSRGHKTRYVAAGTFAIGLSCFLRLVPHLLFGPGQDAVELTEEYGASLVLLNESSREDGVALCGKPFTGQEDCSDSGAISMPAIILFMAHIILGIGGSMYYTLGMAYLDDNTKRSKAPVYLAITQCVRMLGPTLGFVLASYTLSKYVDPSLHPTIGTKDPRWIGAWWLGWAPLGTVSCCLAAIMLLFPKHLPRAAQRKAESSKPRIQRQKSFKDFKMTFAKLVKNKVLVLNTCSGVCFMFGYIGYWIFMPKYLETQYRQSAARASLISGSVGLIFSALGIMASGLVISKFKPPARYLAGWNVIVEIVDAIGHMSWAFLGCPAEDLHGSWQQDGSWSLVADCNMDCDCGPTVKYAPICSLDGSTTFYSACHAGCLESAVANGTRTFSNCSCIPSGSALEGPCAVDCSFNFTLFLITQCTMFLLGSSGKAGNTLIQFRCVDEEDKAMSIGLSEFLLCALAFIPGPIVYGMLLDSACMVWGEVCGQSGNCWLYDGKSLRFLLNFTAAGFLMCGMLLDIGVFYHAKDLQIYDEEDHKPNEEKKKEKSAVLKSLLGNL